MPTDKYTIFLIIVVLIAIVGYYMWRKKGALKVKLWRSPTSVLDNFARDLTAEAAAGSLSPIIGREDEIERLVHILSRRTKNNALLLGESGVGKTAIVAGLAQRINNGNIPSILLGKRVLELDLPALLSGTKYRGEFEQRMNSIIKEIEGAGRTIILFIDEIHIIVQAKGVEGALGVADILKPPLARGDIQAIGATTFKEFEEYIKPDAPLERRFQPIIVHPPSTKETITILQGIKRGFEIHHEVNFSDKATEAAVILAQKYIKKRFLPDKAIDIIDEVGAKVHLEAILKNKKKKEVEKVVGLMGEAAVRKQKKSKKDSKQIHKLEEEIERLGELKRITTNKDEFKEIGLQINRAKKDISLLSKKQKKKTKKTDWPVVKKNDIIEVVASWVDTPTNKIHL